MARYNFQSLYTDVETISNVQSQRNLIKRAVQMALDRVCSSWDWLYLMQEAFITTIAPYTDGTITVSNGSTAITGSSTTFTSAMVGRKLRVATEKAYYIIKSFTSTTSITLEQAYQGSLTSGNTYSIYEDEYRLAADIDHYKLLRQIQNGIALVDLDPTLFDILLPTPTAQADPILSSFIGTKLDTYTTGTVTMSSGGTTITGSSTNWTTVSGLGRGSRILISSQILTVKSVDSDTQITTYETADSAYSSVTYTAYLDNYRIKLYQIPSAARNIYYRYQRLPYPLVNDTDIPDIPEEWSWVLVQGALILAFAQQSDAQKVKDQEVMFRGYINDMIMKIGYLSGNIVRRRKSEDTVPSRPGKLYYPAEYDVKYSA